ncbi:MAG: glycogen debranching protein GlgX [Myxococcales bacterium]|nr:glycogen debranching protein GlgX [Myxococcales bacterium]
MAHATDSPGLGCTRVGSGAHFCVLSHSSTRIELCLFETPDAVSEHRRVEMDRDGHVFRAHVPDLPATAAYGYRAHGPFEPSLGLRHNPSKLLLDPRARRIVGPLHWHPAQQGSVFNDAGHELGPDPRDSAPFAPRAIAVEDNDGGAPGPAPRRPRIPWSRTVVYECHVKGMTALHPQLPPRLRGTYLGLCSQPVVEHLRSLGVTTLSVLPVHERYTDRHLTQLGLSNYWGYATLGYFAPRADFASEPGREIDELKTMVRALHAAGIEVILDVVYNHSAESDRFGPTLSLRGLDNRAYYRLRQDAAAHYENFSGCGNTLKLSSRPCRELVLDSLRYWAQEMEVDGFRFDLAVTLGRGQRDFDAEGAFLSELRADPLLGGLKLIAEPWDMGPDGYRLGAFPDPLREWNDRFRDDARRFVRGDGGARAQLATRLAGSSDIFEPSRRPATSSVSLISCHDGFTLWDTVSYAHKHNEVNGEQGRDGHDHNWSANWGVEGETGNADVLLRRRQVARSLLLILGLGKGVPMLGMGDELGRSQRGNNNAYAQDNEQSWLRWHDQAELLSFTRAVLALRRRHPALRDGRFLHGRPIEPGGPVDLIWLNADGRTMTHDDWLDPEGLTLGMQIRHGPLSPLADGVDALLCVLHAGDEVLRFALPSSAASLRYRPVLDTSSARNESLVLDATAVTVPAHGAVVLEGTTAPRGAP